MQGRRDWRAEAWAPPADQAPGKNLFADLYTNLTTFAALRLERVGRDAGALKASAVDRRSPG